MCNVDLSIQVNGCNVRAATHHEAVSALRNAGSCIKMTVLRDRLPSCEVSGIGGPQDDMTGRQVFSQDGEGQGAKQTTEACLSKTIEAVVCNGNGTVGGFLKLKLTKVFCNTSHAAQ